VSEDVASRFDRPRMRRARLAGALAGGLVLLGSGVQGLAGVDDRLEAASKSRATSAPVERDWRDGDCPKRRERLSERERL
jgi:hypothetical protein